ncbi:MAG: glycerol-3-phosphate 1-O-acyltransferase PlsY [Acidobacteriota bacterium]|nr:glycerol-3-phosphate 1-O-acyltransferase PlsY [Acidobacteriota bacterium]
MSAILLTAGWSYLLGSIPFGYILVRIVRGEDVRMSGSGNVGATNVARSSPLLGIATLVLDALKGLAGVLITRWAFPNRKELLAVAALSTILGHVFSVWLSFRGGKGVATGLGSFALLAPRSMLVMIAVFVLITLVSRRVSLGSITAVALLPILAWWLDGYRQVPLIVLMATASLLIIARHHENIRRLRNGSEARLSLGHK